jgi:hypothetical protein
MGTECGPTRLLSASRQTCGSVSVRKTYRFVGSWFAVGAFEPACSQAWLPTLQGRKVPLQSSRTASRAQVWALRCQERVPQFPPPHLWTPLVPT